MADVAKLKRVLAVVEQAEQVGLWDQGSWWHDVEGRDPLDVDGEHFCGTAYCFAGWTLALEGWKPGYYAHQMVKGEYEVGVDEAAADALDLNLGEAEMLFHEDNSLDDLRRMVAEYCASEEAKVNV